MCLYLVLKWGLLDIIIVPLFSSYNFVFEEKMTLSKSKPNVPNTSVNKFLIRNKSLSECGITPNIQHIEWIILSQSHFLILCKPLISEK